MSKMKIISDQKLLEWIVWFLDKGFDLYPEDVYREARRIGASIGDIKQSLHRLGVDEPPS